MARIPEKVADRLVAGIKKFKVVLTDAHTNKDNESNTVIIITDMLSEIFGYAKYSEITSEIAIRGTFCDLATQIDKKIQSIIEAKAICHELNAAHVTQAVGYASTKGIEWVMLTNGIIWQIYKVTFDKPVDHEKIIEIDFLNVDHRNQDDLESLFRLSKEGWMKSLLDDYYEQKQALSKFSIAAILSTDSVLSVIRKNLKLISPDAKITPEQIWSVLEQEVINKDILTGDKAEDARRKVAKAQKRAERVVAVENLSPSPVPVDPSLIEALPVSASPPSISPPTA